MTVHEPPHRPDEGSFAWAETPLGLLIRDERTLRLLSRLAGQLEALRLAQRTGAELPTLRLSMTEIDYARRQWQLAVLDGERRLYDVATLSAWQLLGTRQLQMAARIIASPRGEPQAHRIVIEEHVEPERLRQTHDSTLAAQIASRYRYRARGKKFVKLLSRASFLELRPLGSASGALATRVLTRVKVDDQIWNKVCDAFFDVDSLVRRDKILNQQSKYIKDVFGIKVLTVSNEASYRVAEVMNTMRFDAGQVHVHEDGDGCEALELIECKDYLALPPDQKKRTGWEAIKNVYRWCGQVFEVQIQTEANYYLEAMDLSDTSHRTFEMMRDELRAELDERVPFYREFRSTLKAIFRRKRRAGRAELPPWLRLES